MFFVLKSEVSSTIETEVMAFFLKVIFFNKVDFGQKRLMFLVREIITNAFQNIINFEWIKIQTYTL